MKKHLLLFLLFASYLLQPNICFAHITKPSLKKDQNFTSASTATTFVKDNTLKIGKTSFTAQSFTITPTNGILYVKKGTAGDGSSWTNALGELADALKFAKTNNAINTNPQVTEIWVARGTYKPMYSPEDGANFISNPTDPRDKAFLLVNNVKLYGGFDPDAGITDLATRNPQLATTILSGDMGIENNIDDNSYHVVVAVSATAEKFFINGFTITKGGEPLSRSGSTIKVNNHELDQIGGGGLYAYGTIDGMFDVAQCNFVSNRSGNGGGVFGWGGGVMMVNINRCTFSENYGYAGGGLYIGSNVRITNSIFDKNSTYNGGGAIHVGGGTGQIFNNNIINNKSTNQRGGGIYVINSTAVVYNNYFKDNVHNVSNIVPNGYADFTSASPATIDFDYNFVQNYSAGTGHNITAGVLQNTGDPLTNTVGYKVQVDGLDFDGKTRVQGSSIDIGYNETIEYIPDANGIVYVNINTPFDGNGSSWQTAVKSLAKVIETSKINTAIKKVWVAKGTYLPMYKLAITNQNNLPTTDKSKTFVYTTDLQLFGGFAGTEDAATFNLDTRNFINNETILSGNLNGNNTGNAQHVVVASGNLGTLAQIDGFTITGGQTSGGLAGMDETVNGNAISSQHGAGIYLVNTMMQLKNLIVKNNIAVDVNGGGNGAGLYFSSTILTNNLKVANVLFSNNSAAIGGAAYHFGGTVEYKNTQFKNNTADARGGAMYNSNNTGTFINLDFSNNKVLFVALNRGGGAMYNGSTTPTNLKFINTLFAQNQSPIGGAITNNGDVNLKVDFINNTFYKNKAVADASMTGAVMHTVGSPEINIANSVFYGNEITDADDKLDILPAAATLIIKNSIMQQFGINGVNNNLVGTDPLFTNPTNGDYTLKPGSPAINKGSNALYTGNINTDNDLAGNPRLKEGLIDMGAYEFQSIPITPTAGILYVDKNVAATSDNSGKDWANAIPELADALKWANENKSNWTNVSPLNIYVAKATYKPLYTPEDGQNFNDSTALALEVPTIRNHRDRTFLMVKDVKLYGGFDPENNISTMVTRNPQIATTILSGDFKNDDVITGNGSTLSLTNNGENAYHVVVSTDAVGTAELNGFTITGGNANSNNSIKVNQKDIYRYNGAGMANSSSSPTISNSTFSANKASYGGGMYNDGSSSPTISNSTFSANTATTNGAGMYNISSSPKISNSTFSANTANTRGGGMANYNSSSPTISNSTFSANTANTSGGGMYNDTSSPTISNSTFSANTANTRGGGMANYNSSLPTISNSTFSANAAIYGGGMYNDTSSPTISNSTFSANTAYTSGVGMFNFNLSNPKISNSIIFGNGTEIANNNSTPIIKYSLIQGLASTADGNINATNISLTDIFTNPTNGDYTLKTGSPAINKGSNQLYWDAVGGGTPLPTTEAGWGLDLAGNPRVYNFASGGIIDMGAYEFQGNQTQSQTINPIATINKTYGDASFEPGGTSTSGLPLTYVSEDNSIAEVLLDGKINIKKAGTVNIKASQAGGVNNNNTYDAATPVVFGLNINKKPVTIALTSAVISKIYDGNTNAIISLANLAFATGDVISGDQLNIALSSTAASYATANGGTAKAVTVSLNNISLSGTSLANYEIANTADVTANVGEITKAVITGVTFVDGSFAYDGTAKSLAITGTLPAGATVSYTGNGETVAGIYTVTANITGGNNYQNQTLTAQLTINKIALTGIGFAGGIFDYDGNAKSLAITGTLPAGVTVSYTGNAQIDAGTYTVTANINGGADYEDQTLTAQLTINKTAITGISFAGGIFDYDGTAKSLAITGILPAGVTVSYTGNAQTNAGTYTVTANINGGANYQNQSLTAQLSINKVMLTITANNASVCQGSSLPTFTTSYTGFKNGERESNLSTRPSLSTIASSSSAAGTYAITASGAVSSNYEITYIQGTLTINALPVIAINSNKGNSISKGETIQLTATGGTNYVWTGEGIISGQNSATLNLRPEKGGIYTVKVTNASGCSSEQTFVLTVREDFAALKATNILTPNGDGINDVWLVENIDVYPDNKVMIFDRANRIIYNKNGYDNSWNGMVNGNPLAEGTYYYVIDFGAGKPKQKGFITLIR